MKKVGLALVFLIAALHVYIAWFEIFAWTTRGPRVFPTLPPELFAQTVELAANQGLYNGFLAAGLLWALLIRDPRWQRNVATCFLVFVALAGVGAAVTLSVRAGLLQFGPAVAALLLLHGGGLWRGPEGGAR
jgi:putative membrane protein